MIAIGEQIALIIVGSPVLTLIAKATIVSAAALVAVRLARRRPASIRHLVVATSFVVLAVLPLASSAIPARQVTVPIAAPPGNISATPAAVGVTTSIAGVSQLADGSPIVGSSPGPTLPALSTVLLIVWVSGTAIFILPLMRGLMRVRRLRRRGLPWRDGQRLVASIASASGTRRRIEVLLDDAADGPMTCGIIRPAVILSREARQWPEGDLRRAIIHELEHVTRADWLTQCVARSVCAVYWFHPLVWMLWRQLRLEAERACDDAVLLSADAETYADQLVTLAERLVSNRARSTLAMADRDDLAARVAAVLDSQQSRGRAGALRRGGAVALAAIAIATIGPLRAVAVTHNLHPAGDRPLPLVAVPKTTADTSDPSQPTVRLARETSGPPPAPAFRVTQAPQGPPSDVGTTPSVDSPKLNDLSFEVASIKPILSAGYRFNGSGMNVGPGGRFSAINYSLSQLIQFAYNLRQTQMIDGPDWISTERFTVEAKASTDAPRDQVRVMVQGLLADRFKLLARREVREMPIVELVLVRNDGRPGPRLHDCSDANDRGGISTPEKPFRAPPGGAIAAADCSGLASIARFVSAMLHATVVDKTGLTGEWRYDMYFGPDMVSPGANDPGLPSFEAALREQLGLKLERKSASVDVLVIESVNRPTAN